MSGGNLPDIVQGKNLLSAVLLLAGLLLTGCERTGPADALLVDYQRRWADVVGLPPPEPQPPANIGAFPDQRERVFDIPETRESLLNVYALRECNITSLVAERNNQLGRVAVPSRQWLYELELWHRLSHCLNSDVVERLGESHRDRLERLTLTKTRQLPMVGWNALFGSSEWAGSFSRASRPLAPDGLADIEPYLAALDYLRDGILHQFDRTWRPDSSTLSGHLQTLSREPLTAQLLRSLMLAGLRLEETNALLEDALARRLSCRGEDNPLHSPALRYIDELEDRAGRWLASLEALLDAHSVSLPQVDAYRHEWLSRSNPDAPWPRFQQSRQAHRQLLAQWSAKCALTPVDDVGEDEA